MFRQIYVAYIKIIFHTKALIFWTMLFPLLLGTLFYAAFHSIYSSQQSKTIPAAVVVEQEAIQEFQVLSSMKNLMDEDVIQSLQEKNFDFHMLEEIQDYDDLIHFDYQSLPEEIIGEPNEISRENLPFIQLLNDLTYEDGKDMIKIQYADRETAKELLSQKEVTGIFHVQSLQEVSLEISENGTYESILSHITTKYRDSVRQITDSIKNNPGDMENFVFSYEQEETEYIQSLSLAGENTDPYVIYFYNLITMICLLGSITVLELDKTSKANETASGCRICASPVKKSVYELAVFAACLTFQLIVTALALVYSIDILKIRFGGNIAAIILTSLLGNILGCSLGFFIVNIGQISCKAKNTILMWITLGGGFLSGLMVPGIKTAVIEHCPIVNKINPSAVITDAFYSLNMFGTGKRFQESILYIVILSIVFLAVGILRSRRNEYASL